MIITEEDVHNFEIMYEKYIGRDYYLPKFSSEFSLWLNDNPHILMVDNFSDYTSAISHNKDMIEKLIDHKLIDNNISLFRKITGEWVIPIYFGDNKRDKWMWLPFIALDNSYNFINKLNKFYEDDEISEFIPEFSILDGNVDIFSIDPILIGAYLDGNKDGSIYKLLKTFPDEILKSVIATKELYLDRYEPEADYSLIKYLFFDINYERIYKKLIKYVKNPLVDKRNFISPNIFIDKSLSIQNDYLRNTTGNLITSIQNNKVDLNDISWKQLEEIIAEIFKSQGMQIVINKNVPQGGRDIIGRFNNGFEFVDVAIEVKHRHSVDMPLLSSFLQQNRMFPLLYLVTSGKFSAGVINEQKKYENRLRIKLYDGVAVKSLINMYKTK